VFGQTYEHLLLVHWPVPEKDLRALLPARVEPISFEGTTWIGHDVYLGTEGHVRGLPPIDGFDTRPVITLRTIVEVDGVRGIYLLSMDAPNRLAVWAERHLLGLRSHTAEVNIDAHEGGASVKALRSGSAERLAAVYAPTGPPVQPAEGSRDRFLLGGDRLYTGEGARLHAIDVQHGPWALCPARVTIEIDTLAASSGLPVPGPDPVAVYQRAQAAYTALPHRI
jgi:uncharacterized protein YqjF (DUF2071 family)